MTYQIEWTWKNEKYDNLAYSRKDLLEWLKILKDETISDIKKLYKNGVSVSVTEKYRNYINRQNKS